MLLDLLSQIEPDDSWRPQLPDLHPPPYPHAAYTLATASILVVDTITGNGPGPSGILHAGTVRQYMASVGPLFVETTPPAVTTLEWIPQLPAVRGLSPRATGWFAFIPLSITTPASDHSWGPIFPDRLPPPVARAAYQPGTYSLVVDTLSGYGPGPSGILWMGRTRQYQGIAAPLFVEPPLTQILAWAIYPDRLNRVTLPPALMPAFFYGTWVPIPNPPVTLILEDRILIGQNQSLETPFYPSIGGSTTWS